MVFIYVRRNLVIIYLRKPIDLFNKIRNKKKIVPINSVMQYPEVDTLSFWH